MNEGLTLVMAAVRMGVKTFGEESSDDDLENFNDVMQMTIKKCNVQDTVQMTFINNYLINRMNNSHYNML